MKIARVLYSKSIKDILDHIKNKKDWKRILSSRTEKTKEYLEKYADEPKLQIGCGVNVVEGWLNTDLLHNKHVVFLDAGNKYPFEDNSFQFIYAEHLFEHLTLEQEITMLKECYRVLKPGGVLRLALPSSDFLMDILAGAPETAPYVEWAIDNIPRLEPVKNNIKTKEDFPVYVVNNFYRDWGHQTIHNKQTLKNLLESTGYTNVISAEVGESKHEGLKNMERHMISLPEELNKLETMILEGTKANLTSEP